ncbi:oxidoreductase [Virgisporangium aliadipatigenens]|uniref:Oxidoreductase n=1 Tax=Virgisporangium aliadipatigenens TaxID=741659 RepID=A0A8J4DVX8_9ACTN|nr:xanthine dehydrogenase family protein subunit M [Virgisporangium aliadipatigenens]GIJ50592.1 oxidoreductase [Virgisporangium aliadipatigenens]
MREFTYTKAADAAEAVRLAAAGARYLGGGTNLVDLMREEIERPTALVDVSGLAQGITEHPDGSVEIGAATRNTAVAAHPRIRRDYPVLARAIVSGASGQIRNAATVGGNLLQRTRCPYFYDVAARCNKREPGSGCDARQGFHRTHAVLATSAHCIATHPSDMCVALVALDAQVHILGPAGARVVAVADLYRDPGETPHLETVLGPAELITAVRLPRAVDGAVSTYRKVRDRTSYAFALVSVAAVLRVVDATVADVRIALGGVASRPWRARVAERELLGAPAEPDTFKRAAEAEFRSARPLPDNAFKVSLAPRVVADVLKGLSG